MIEGATPERTAEITGLPVETLNQMAKGNSQSEPSAICYVLGLTQHSTDTDNGKSLANLAMLCGHIGRPSTGVNPIRGPNNLQGTCDMGCLPYVFPGYQYITVPETRACLPNSVQLLTPCTTGNGWLKVMDLGRFALSLYVKYQGEGIRVNLDSAKARGFPDRATPMWQDWRGVEGSGQRRSDLDIT